VAGVTPVISAASLTVSTSSLIAAEATRIHSRPPEGQREAPH
jgi:hypothetical protein